MSTYNRMFQGWKGSPAKPIRWVLIILLLYDFNTRERCHNQLTVFFGGGGAGINCKAIKKLPKKQRMRQSLKRLSRHFPVASPLKADMLLYYVMLGLCQGIVGRQMPQNDKKTENVGQVWKIFLNEACLSGPEPVDCLVPSIANFLELNLSYKADNKYWY